MSFRELRSFAETMRLLGYPNLISMESFRNPNVELVADCLYWLIKRYEPSAEIVYEIAREADRVYFFKQVCEIALTKGRIKLNIKKLYQCDGNAVQEMLILAGVLKKAMSATEAEEPDYTGLQQMVAQKNVQDAKRVQQLCSDLTSDGSSLFFLIEEEISQRVERQRVLSRATEVGEFERRLRDVLNNVGKQVEQLQTAIANLGADETTLEQKIESKKTQLERAQKRLKSLMAVRPAFMEEYEKHEADLQSQFVVYLEQYCNLEYLKHELARFNAAEDALLEEHETRLRVMRERLRKEELNALRGEANRKRATRSQVGPPHSRKRTLPKGQDDEGDDDGDEDDETPGGNRRAPPHGRVRDAAADGSSRSDSSETSGAQDPPRPQAAFGRPRPSPATDAAPARRGDDGYSNSKSDGTIGGSGSGGGVGAGGNMANMMDAEEEAAEARMTDIRKGRGTDSGPSSGYNPYGGMRGGGGMSEDEDDESETDDDSDSDIDTSDISTDSDDSDDDDSSSSSSSSSSSGSI
ncbi:Clusterin-associated protein-1 [Trypanosoma melophagium]|uniref:Clusterin-associated protein-1 n=1 Tax=Trypanosoma melophagium TaxID=715481 RepID=UPI00351A7880|nr:Clusterin-associated protein-1 [Trypanosoma melophagium]